MFLKTLKHALSKILLGELVQSTILDEEWIEDHSPLLTKLRRRLNRLKPFRGETLGVCLPGTWETYMLLKTFECGGASIYFLPMFCNPQVLRRLQQTAIEVVRRIPLTKTDFIYDTDATVGKSVIERKLKVKGIVEQTTSGVKKYIEYDRRGLLKQPVMDLNGSYVKRTFENRLATGLGLVDALLKLRLFLPCKRVLIIGFGDVGFSCALYLKRLGCKVDIYDIDKSKLSEAGKLGYSTGNLYDLLPRADIIVTATGSAKPALSDKELYLLKNGAVLANMGGKGWRREIFQRERVKLVGNNILKLVRNNGTYIYELAKGYPVNLAMASGSDTETMDIIFSLGVLTMEYLVRNYEALPKHVLSVPEEIESQFVSYRSLLMSS